jgi:hypothetical protein
MDSASRSHTSAAGGSAVDTTAPTPEPFSEPLVTVEIEETVATVKHARYQEGAVVAAKSLQRMKEQYERVRVIRDESSTEPSTGKHERELADVAEYNKLWAEKRLGVGFLSTLDSERAESSTGPPDDFDDEPQDELIGLVVRTPVETGDSLFPDNDNDSIVSLDERDRPFHLEPNSSPTSNVSVNGGTASLSAESLSPMAAQSVCTGG